MDPETLAPTQTTIPAIDPAPTSAPTADQPSLVEGVTTSVAEEPKVPTSEAPTPEAPAPFVFKEEDLKVPEGLTLDPAVKAEFIALANEHKIPPAAAEALVGLQAKLAQAGADASTKAWQDMQTTWRGEVQAHPELGGEKLEGVLSNVAKLVDKYGSADFRQVMTLTGAGNNVHVIQFLNSVAGQLVEAAPVTGAPVSSPQSLADSLFTTMTKKG